jgi:hypothetical protein
MWSDVPSYEPPAPATPGAVIPLGDQPVLQLGLDVPMWENYFNALGGAMRPDPDPPFSSAPHDRNIAMSSDIGGGGGDSGGGGGSGGGGTHQFWWDENRDAVIRQGAWFEPIVNCFGLWCACNIFFVSFCLSSFTVLAKSRSIELSLPVIRRRFRFLPKPLST